MDVAVEASRGEDRAIIAWRAVLYGPRWHDGGATTVEFDAGPLRLVRELGAPGAKETADRDALALRRTHGVAP